MKVIFLDVDGVICCNAEGELEHSKLLRLKRVADETGAKIVISSDWRRHPHLLAQLVDVLTNEYGMSCIGATPAGPPDLAMRPSEIYTWLKSWNEQATSVDKVTSYVAVDDRDLATEMGGDKLMRGRMLLTVYEDGLTDEIARRMAEKLLESDAQPWRHRAAPQPIVARGLSPPLGRPARGQGRRRRRQIDAAARSPGHAHQRRGGGRRADADPLSRRRFDPPRAAAPAAPRAAPVVRAAGRARDLRRPHAASPREARAAPRLRLLVA